MLKIPTSLQIVVTSNALIGNVCLGEKHLSKIFSALLQRSWQKCNVPRELMTLKQIRTQVLRRLISYDQGVNL